MPDFITLTCPTCGAKLNITQDLERYACAHCGNEYITNRVGGITTQKIVNLRTVSPNITPKKSESKPSQISVTLVNKVFHKADYSVGDAGDRIDFTFLFQSLLERDVRAFKGAVIFKDLFDQEILRVTLTHETGLPKKGTAVWKGGIQYNQFMETHQRLLTVEKSDITVSFACESIVYADGTRESFT